MKIQHKISISLVPKEELSINKTIISWKIMINSKQVINVNMDILLKILKKIHSHKISFIPLLLQM